MESGTPPSSLGTSSLQIGLYPDSGPVVARNDSRRSDICATHIADAGGLASVVPERLEAAA
jgi:hypothetical protein